MFAPCLWDERRVRGAAGAERPRATASLTRAQLLQLAELLLNPEQEEVVQDVPQLLLGVQTQALQVAIPQSEQRAALEDAWNGDTTIMVGWVEGGGGGGGGAGGTCT